MSRRDMIQSGRAEAVIDRKYGRGVFGGRPNRPGAADVILAYYVEGPNGPEWFGHDCLDKGRARALELGVFLHTQEVW